MSRGIIRVDGPAGEERRFEVSRPVTIGRDRGSDVAIEDARVSRRHATLEFEPPNDWVLVDRSVNGTFHEGKRIERLQIAGPTDVCIGHVSKGPMLRISPGGASPEMPGGGVRRAPDREKKMGESSIGVFSSVHDPAKLIRIGRDSGNDIVVDDLLVSRRHAELRKDHDGGFVIVDLGSHNGTYVDGRRVDRARLIEGAIISIGHHLFRLHQGRFEEYVDTGEITFSAQNLSVMVGTKTLLDDVSFCLTGGNFMAVLGPTGAGKSTLLKALTGTRPADRGTVLYNGRDLYTTYAELRHRIGYVPQDDILHPQLTVRRALAYSAQLRFPADVTASERDRRVEEVMAELGLRERADVSVAKLSGGQRKRTSVAIELLTRPSLLLLDEPTSGLDPGYEKSVMQLLRGLADDGRTVITVTHSVQSLERCDRILFLAPGGQAAFMGPPSEALPYFAEPEYADIFQRLEHASPGEAKEKFLRSPLRRAYVDEPLGLQGAATGDGRPSVATDAPNAASWGHQLRTLVRRYVSVIVADRRNTALIVTQAPILGLLMLSVLGHGHLTQRDGRSGADTVLLALVLGAAYLGAGNSIREIVKERPLLTRERSVGLSPSAYVLSKALVLGILTVIQATVLVAFGIARQGGPGHGSVIGPGTLELIAVVSLTGLSAMALGLLISAFVSNADKALTLLPLVLFAQFLLSGSAFNLKNTPVLGQISYLTSARWGYAAAASTANLDSLDYTGCHGAQSRPQVPTLAVPCDSIRRHSATAWTIDMAALLALTVIPLAGATLVLRPLGQPRRR